MKRLMIAMLLAFGTVSPAGAADVDYSEPPELHNEKWAAPPTALEPVQATTLSAALGFGLGRFYLAEEMRLLDGPLRARERLELEGAAVLVTELVFLASSGISVFAIMNPPPLMNPPPPAQRRGVPVGIAGGPHRIADYQRDWSMVGVACASGFAITRLVEVLTINRSRRRANYELAEYQRNHQH